MCCYLLHCERRADLLSSEDHGALGQNLRQLEGVQSQQLAHIADHCRHTHIHTHTNVSAVWLMHSTGGSGDSHSCQTTDVTYRLRSYTGKLYAAAALGSHCSSPALCKRGQTQRTKAALSSCCSLFGALSAGAASIKLQGTRSAAQRFRTFFNLLPIKNALASPR